MKILVFGNADEPSDSLALEVSTHTDFSNIEFQIISPNDDLPILDDQITILDTVMGIDAITIIGEDNLNQFILSPRTSVHDYDLGFQLKYLTKIGKLKRFTIIGLPINKPVDYDLLHSILRKLVAQDIQGS